jgi:hypothetical protein
MALAIPIISTFDGGGVSKAINEFKNLEGAGKKAQFAIKKAAVPAAAALAGLAVVLGDAVKGAMEDAAAQAELARQLKATTGANDAQIASVEDWITAQGKALGITDDELRPAFAGLVRATGDVAHAQKLASQAFDLAAQKGLPLETVTKALEKAYGGNLTALAKLAPEYRQMIKDGASFEDVMYAIGLATDGAATVAANTAEGKFKRFQVAMNETKESVGNALLPVLEAALPALQAFGDWAQNNPTAFTIIAAAIGAVALSIMAVNVAMALNPFSLIAAGIALLVVGLAVAYKKFEGFRNIVNGVVNSIIGYFEFLANSWIKVINGLIRGYNAIPFTKDISLVADVTFGRLGESRGPSGADKSRFDTVPAMAEGGVVNTPGGMLALIGEAGPEAVIPLDRLGQMGGGGTTVNINVNGGDPQSVVDALRTYMFRNGSVPIRISG